MAKINWSISHIVERNWTDISFKIKNVIEDLWSALECSDCVAALSMPESALVDSLQKILIKFNFRDPDFCILTFRRCGSITSHFKPIRRILWWRPIILS
jgi:hypothetical protein